MRTLFSILAWLVLAMPAAAVTTHFMNMTLQWESTSFRNVELEDNEWKPPSEPWQKYTNLGSVSLEDDIWGLPHVLDQLDLSQPIQFSLTLQADPQGYTRYRAIECDFGGITCTAGGNSYVNHANKGGSDFMMHWGLEVGYHIWGDSAVGGTVGFNDFSDYIRRKEFNGGLQRTLYRDVSSQFTVVESSTITSMPVPGALPLLAAGLMGLGVLKRRRRR